VVLGAAPLAWQNISQHLADVGGELQKGGDYMHIIYITFFIALAAFLSASKRSSWKQIMVITGLALIYLGTVAITIPNYSASWGIVGGITSLAGGVMYLVFPLMGMFKKQEQEE
jgi:hypothetical protein